MVVIGDLSVLDKNYRYFIQKLFISFSLLNIILHDSYVRYACLSPISLTMLKCLLNIKRQMNKSFIQKRNISKEQTQCMV